MGGNISSLAPTLRLDIQLIDNKNIYIVRNKNLTDFEKTSSASYISSLYIKKKKKKKENRTNNRGSIKKVNRHRARDLSLGYTRPCINLLNVRSD